MVPAELADWLNQEARRRMVAPGFLVTEALERLRRDLVDPLVVAPALAAS